MRRFGGGWPGRTRNSSKRSGSSARDAVPGKRATEGRAPYLTGEERMDKMRTMIGGMVGEGILRTSADPGILQRRDLDFASQVVLRFPARTAAAAVQNPTAAAGGGSEIDEYWHLAHGNVTKTEVYPEIPTPRMPAQREPKQVCYRPAHAFEYLLRALEALQMISPWDLQKEKAFAKLRQYLDDHE
jgi:hypothetical protein